MIKINGSLIRQYAVVITVNLSILCSGLTIAWPSPVLVKLRNETLSTLSRPITEEEASFLTCYLVDRVGRKYTVIISYLPRLVMCVIMVFASEVWMILVGRALCGVADTFIFTKEVRGSLGTFLQILASIGILIMLCSGPFMEYLSVNIMVLCFSIVTLIPLFFLPESPYFLYSKGRKEEALKVLLSVRDTETAAKDELKEFSLTEKDAKISKRELFRNKTFIKSASIAIIIGIGSQLIGFNAVSFYLQTVLESTQTNVSSEIASGVIGCIQLLAAFSTTLITDRFGRKPILASTLVGQAVGMIGLGVFYKLKEDSTGEITGYMNYVPLISLIIVVYSFSAGLGSLTWCLLAELFDGRGRAIGVTISMNISIIFMFLTVKYFAMITTTIGYATTYGIFSVNCVLMCLFICFCVPETKGKSIAEIQAELGSRDVSDVKGGNC
ncbi:hypothetical protein MSG28_014116 [Choristoneura fumiferana]|uniref:Uncharacterized protein n=1 Tax=Choristoneura fumiferana TaxID=7141 RepID=A0ACC0JG00_CHOFU|nr:hypothetical protein MSG28_014116 [Choristoneura fumiferana]